MTNLKTTKRALLSSVIALLVCFTMLLGTTFAWFTDSVTSAGNKIVAGTLEVDLLMADENGNYASIAGKDAAIFGEGSLAQDNAQETVWEPGKTQIVYLAVENKGNLDLKYNIALNVVDGGLIGSLEYAIVDGAQYGALDTYTDWETLKANAQTGDVVAGTTVAAPNGAITVAEKTEYFALAVHMKEEAGNKYLGKDITIDVTVLATQLASESDSFGNQYDKDAGVITVTPDTVQAALDNAADNTVIQLTAGNYGVLTLAPVEGGQTTVLDSTTGYLSRSINGLTIKGAAGVKVDGIKVAVDGGNTISLNNIVIDGVDFTGVAEGFVCTVNNVPLKNFTMQNCTMTSGGGKDLVKLRTPENVTITNCTVDGAARLLTTGSSKNITITNNTINNVTEHGIHLSNGIHSGTIVVSGNKFNAGGTNARFIRFADVDDAKLIITDNEVRGYVPTAGSENDYIKITYKNDVEPNVTISGNKYEYQGTRLWISVKGEEYIQSTPDKLN